MNLEEFRKEKTENNPNITFDDLYEEDELNFLHQYFQISPQYSNVNPATLNNTDQLWLESQGISFTDAMEGLLDSRARAQPAPLPPPPMPTELQETDQWQAYLASNAGLKNWTPATDPDEVKNILNPPLPQWMQQDQVQKRIEEEVPMPLKGVTSWAAGAVDFAQTYGGMLTPQAFSLRKWKKQAELARAGIPYEEGASIKERAAASLVPRGYTPKTIENIAYSQGEPRFDDYQSNLAAEWLYPGRPQGEQGPIIRKTRNSDGSIEKIFPFNEPGVTAGDYAHYVLRDAVPIGGDIAATVYVGKRLKKGKTFYQTPWKKVKNWGEFAAASGYGTAAGEYARLVSGIEFIDPDLTYEDAMKESLLLGSYATAGAAGATAILSGTRATWNFFTGKNPPDFLVNNLLKLRKTYQQNLKKAGVLEGSEEAGAILDKLIGRSTKEVQEVMQEATGQTYKIFLGEGQFGADANFALGLLNTLEAGGLPATKVLETLHSDILNNEIARNMFAQKLLLGSGSKEGAQKAAAELGEQLNDETIPKLLNEEIEGAWTVFRQQVEQGKIDQGTLLKLGIDDAALLGLKPATNKLPGELGDDITMSKYLFQEVKDPTSLLNAFRNPVISRLHRFQRDYMVPIQKKLDDNLKVYGGLSTPLNTRSPMAIEIRKIFKGNGISILKKDKAFKEWLTKNVDGDGSSIRQSIARLEGRSVGGQFGKGEAITFKELHELRIDLHTMKNSLSGKLNEPTERAVNNLIGAVERQQDLMLVNGAKVIKPTGQSVKTFMDNKNYGLDYWDNLAEYSNRSRLAGNRFVENFLKRGEEFDESLVPALMAANVPGSATHPLANPLMAMLRDAGDEGFDAINKIQRAVAQRYRKDVIEPFTEQRNYKGMKELHDKWMEKNGGLIESVFPDQKGYVWKNMKQVQKLTGDLVEHRQQTLNEIAEYFGDITGSADPAEMILRIVRGEGLENVSGALRLRKKLAEIIKRSGDDTLEKEINSVIRKDIYNQIMVTDPMVGGMTGKMRLDPAKLDALLTEDFVVGVNNKGLPDAVSFKKLYSPFLKAKEIDDLFTLNSAVQSEVQRKTAGGNVARAAMDIGSKESVDIPTLGRLIFGPLNKYTYRFGWRQRALESRAADLLGEAVMDPKILDKLARQIDRRMSVDQAVRFLYSLDSVIANDLGRDLQVEYMEPDNQNVFRTKQYENYIKEFFAPVSEKERGSRSGVIPFRENVEQLLPTGAPAGAAVAADKVINIGSEIYENFGGSDD